MCEWLIFLFSFGIVLVCSEGWILMGKKYLYNIIIDIQYTQMAIATFQHSFTLN